IGAQLVLALNHLHDNGVVHRCLNPELASLDWRGRVRITDLSTCKQKGCAFELDVIKRLKYPFIAPEILKGEVYEPASDWWSLGCCLYQMLTGKALLSQHDSIDSLIKDISKDNCKEAIEETGIKSIKEHPFFGGIDWQKLATDESVGTIQMDLSYSIWSAEQTKIEGVLGPDYGAKYANCHIIQHKKTGEEGVMKLVWKAEMRKTNSGWKRVMNERLAWQKVSGHQYTAGLKGFFETEAAYCFVSEHIRDAVSLSVVIKSAPLPTEVVKYLAGQLAIAVNHMHARGVLHRSLSPECIFIEKCGRLRLCDFESAKLCEFSCHPFGDCSYLAPEIIQGKEYGKEADWWAVGVILVEMLLGNTPLDIFCDKRQITDDCDIDTELLLRVTESIPKMLTNIESIGAQNLLKQLLVANPEQRLGFKRNAYNEIKSHQFFKGLLWPKLESPETEL
ncbi:unnamed protein product, partial [Medioppia subpectinata]